MSSRFFTNEGHNTLENRLRDILQKHPNIAYLEFLIGYFRISGFVKIASLLHNIKKARILVGIDVDSKIYEAKERGKEPNIFDVVQDKERFIVEQVEGTRFIDGLQKENYSWEVEKSVELLARYLAEERVEIRICPSKNIHAKIYILRQEPIQRHDETIEQIGSVITGSSNLSANGLAHNFEFNVELRDSDDIAYALNEFEKLWNASVELQECDIKKIKERTYLKEITPYELYIKFLIEYFQDRIDYDPNIIWNLPKGFKKLAYQIDAVKEGIEKIKKHNGFFLADVVGLGKTVTAAMIVKKLLTEIKGEVLVVAPPTIQKEWRETFKKFEIGSLRNFDIVSLGKLEGIDPQKYELIIIDESHRFRNYATSRYKELERICKERSKYHKKVILISATPLNNRPLDIANQLYLFQDKRASTIPSQPNLERFFGGIAKEYQEIIASGSTELTQQQKEHLKRLAQKIRDDILREVMVRRTRTDILQNEMYRKDLEEQGLSIPEVKPVEELRYVLDDELVKIFEESVDILLSKLQYERYKILHYLKPEARKQYGKISENIFEKGALQLARLMQMLLVKRFESSFYAFKLSVAKQLEHLEKLLQMFENDEIYVGLDLNIYDLLEDEDAQEKIDVLLEKKRVRKFSAGDFEAGYKEKLQSDLVLLRRLHEMWQKIEEDPKLDRFKTELQKHKGKKIVVFTESKDTALYLKSHLQEFRVLCVHGENRDALKETIRQNFDANYPEQKDEFDIIIATDTLSEGVNLHRSNIIFNYDIPWNSTKLMQRIGRINRIGTPHKEIFIYNFIPTAQSERYIELSKKAFIKLQTFHSTLGEDNKIYSQEEEVGSVELFEGVEEEVDEELLYLQEVRDFKKTYPKKFQHIVKLPQKVRVQRAKEPKNVSFVFVKTSKNHGFYRVSDEVEPINFLQMAKALKAAPNKKGVMPIGKIHYEQVGLALEVFEKELLKTIQTSQKPHIANKTDKQAMRLLKSWRDKHIIEIEMYQLFKKLIEDGRYQNLARQIKALQKKSGVAIVEELEKIKKELGLLEETSETKKIDLDIEIVLSETYVGEVDGS